MTMFRNAFLALLTGVLLILGGCRLLPAVLSTINPGVLYRVPNAGRTLYLTLDDGPSKATPLILEVLRRHGVKATFFVITDRVQPELMKRISADGHHIAHHMRTTENIGAMTPETFEAEFLLADQALASYAAVKLFRPPNGSISSSQAAFVASCGYQTVAGTIFPLDHWLESEMTIIALARLLVTDGGIIILHDTDGRGTRAAAVLDTLIPVLKQKGYVFSLLPAPGQHIR